MKIKIITILNLLFLFVSCNSEIKKDNEIKERDLKKCLLIISDTSVNFSKYNIYVGTKKIGKSIFKHESEYFLSVNDLKMEKNEIFNKDFFVKGSNENYIQLYDNNEAYGILKKGITNFIIIQNEKFNTSKYKNSHPFSIKNINFSNKQSNITQSKDSFINNFKNCFNN